MKNKDGYGFIDLEYPNGRIIPSIIMGNGSVMVYDVNNIAGANQSGIAFAFDPKNNTIGTDDESCKGKLVSELDINLQILFDNEKSIDVVISKLLKARETLTKPTHTETVE